MEDCRGRCSRLLNTKLSVQEMESCEGMTHGTIDGLTLKKIIRRTTGAGQLQFIAVALPQSRSSQGVVERQLLVTAGVPLDDQLLRKVCHP